jgi:hypothetical protein
MGRVHHDIGFHVLKILNRSIAPLGFIFQNGSQDRRPVGRVGRQPTAGREARNKKHPGEREEDFAFVHMFSRSRSFAIQSDQDTTPAAAK